MLTLCIVPPGWANHILHSTTMCAKEGFPDTHTIDVIYTRPDQSAPCRVYHTKAGTRQQVGSGNNRPPGAKSCESIEKNIADNLRRGGHQCTTEIAPVGTPPDHTVYSGRGRTAADQGRYAIRIDTFRTEDDAQIFAAGIKRLLPFAQLQIRKVAYSSLPFAVDLGAERSEEDARALAEKVGAVAQTNGAVIDLFPQQEEDGEPVEADWQRYAVASCFRQGHDTRRSMAKCSGLLLDARQLSSCLNGGLCRPPQLAASVSANPDAVFVSIPSRAFIEQRWNGDEIAACFSDSTQSDDEAPLSCGLNRMLTADQRKMLNCGVGANSQVKALACMAGPRLGPSERKMLECLEAHDGATPISSCVVSDYASQDTRAVAACFDQRGTEEFASCIAANVSAVTEQRVTNCVERMSGDAVAAGLCAADIYLTARQRRAIECWSRTHTVAGFGTCALSDDLGLSAADQMIATCAATTEGEPERFTVCAGGSMTLRALKGCAANGGEEGTACLGDGSAIARFIRHVPSGNAEALGADSKIVQQRLAVLGDGDGEATGAIDRPEGSAVSLDEEEALDPDIAADTMNAIESTTESDVDVPEL